MRGDSRHVPSRPRWTSRAAATPALLEPVWWRPAADMDLESVRVDARPDGAGCCAWWWTPTAASAWTTSPRSAGAVRGAGRAGVMGEARRTRWRSPRPAWTGRSPSRGTGGAPGPAGAGPADAGAPGTRARRGPGDRGQAGRRDAGRRRQQREFGYRNWDPRPGAGGVRRCPTRTASGRAGDEGEPDGH